MKTSRLLVLADERYFAHLRCIRQKDNGFSAKRGFLRGPVRADFCLLEVGVGLFKGHSCKPAELAV